MQDAKTWAQEQWGRVELGHPRLTARAVAMGAKMAAHPEASLPEQMQSPAALKGAYRLLDHACVTLERLVAPHCQETLKAAGELALVLMVEDTTELDYTHHPHTQGLGPIGDGRGRGLLLHSTLAVRPDTREVLGLAHVQVVLRQAKVHGKHWPRSPEGRLWEVSARAVGRPPQRARWVHVSDRASDIYEYLVACVELDKHFVIRAFRNRALVWAKDDPQASQLEAQHILDYARSLPAHPDSAFVVEVPARGKQPARQAHLVLQWQAITLPAPTWAPADIRQHGPLQVGLVRAWEPQPPDGAEPVEWVLLCSWPIRTLAQAQQVLDFYTCRWLCEDYHQCLKTGCRIERSQLDHANDILRLLGFATLIAVRLLQLRQAVRVAPDVPAHTCIQPLMLRLLAHQQQLDPRTLTLEQFWHALARLGGHQGRRADGPPGWRTLWRGWRYLSDLLDGATLFASLDSS